MKLKECKSIHFSGRDGGGETSENMCYKEGQGVDLFFFRLSPSSNLIVRQFLILANADHVARRLTLH